MGPRKLSKSLQLIERYHWGEEREIPICRRRGSAERGKKKGKRTISTYRHDASKKKEKMEDACPPSKKKLALGKKIVTFNWVSETFICGKEKAVFLDASGEELR